MSLRYKGGLISPSVNPLAANVTTSPSVAQYNGVFNLQEQGRAITSGEWCTDPYYKNTTLLLHADGKANGSQNNTFLDSSTNAFAITRNGNTTQGSFTPYKGSGFYSCWLGNSATWNYVTYPSAVITFGAGATFTVEGWIYVNAYQGSAGYLTPFLGAYDQTTINAWTVGLDYQGYPLFNWYDGAGKQAKGANVIPLNTWTFVQFVANAGSVSIYVNGIAQTLSGTTTLTNPSQSSTLSTGTERQRNTLYSIADLRVSNIVRAAFLPTAPMSSDANTKLLTLRSNRFYDESSNNYTVTVPSGTTPTIQPFNPFAPQYQYTPAVIGGSGYFDGTGDSLTSSITAIGTSDFTVEYYSYLTAHSGGNGEGGYFQTSSTAGGFSTTYTTGIYATRSAPGAGRVLVVAVGGTPITTTYVPPLNEWFHTAIVRQSNSVKVYVNGVLVSTPTTISTNLTGTYVVLGGYYSTSYLMTGYLSGFRVVNSAVYTAAFTVPTAPPTAIASTTYLVNCTNAGIYDNAMMNDLETVGNAQVSTSVVKYGSGSMYFDGSGDFLMRPSSDSVNFGTGDFTVEFWLNAPDQTVNYPGIISSGTYNVSGSMSVRYDNTGYVNKIFIYVNGGGDPILASSTTIPNNTWAHVAITRSGTVLTIYIDGVRSGVAAISSSLTCNLGVGEFRIGRGFDVDGAAAYFTGYLDDIRLTKGVARYTGNFQPPKVAMPNQ